MSPLRRAITVLLLASLGALSALVLGACGSDDIFGGDADEQVKISLTERDLSPGRVSVDSGEIEFVVENDGDRVHQFAVETSDGVERTDEIKPGDSANITVDLSAGRYQMYDPRGGYRSRGVSGTVVVTSDRGERTVTERTTTVVEEDDDIDVPEVDEPEVQDPEVQDPPAQPAPPPPVAPPTVTQTVPAPAPPPDEPTENP